MYNSTTTIDDNSRRDFLRKGSIAAIGAGSFALGVGATAAQCGGGRSLSTYVQMIAGGFSEIRVLLPDLGLSASVIAQVGDLLDKGKQIAQAFDEAYKAGKFTDAATLFTNLGGIVSQVVGVLGVSTDNKAVKVALAAIGIARIAVSILLQKQSEQPQVAAALKARQPIEIKAMSEVERLAATDLNKVLQLLQP